MASTCGSCVELIAGGASILADLITAAPHAEQKAFEAIKASGAPVVLFGAGELAWCYLAYLRQDGIEPECFCDNDLVKQGTVYLGLPVYSYEGLEEKWGPGAKYNIVLSVGPQYTEAIISQLGAAHEQNPHWYLRGYEVCGEKITHRYFVEHLAQFEEAYGSLADDVSRRVFTNVVNAKLSGDFQLYRDIMGQSQYFDRGIVRLSGHEVLMDVGAHRGDVIVEFARQTGSSYDGIIALEPDSATATLLEENLRRNGIDGVEIHNKAAWHKRASLRFHEGRAGSSRVTESEDPAMPGKSIEVDTIDSVLQGRRVTYISMDIEGAEHNALLGGEQTIKAWRPRLAVCVYHKREDLFDLILLLKSFVPDYALYLRHYTDNQTETVVYAV
jgi:FkbM family methyltransferase